MAQDKNDKKKCTIAHGKFKTDQWVPTTKKSMFCRNECRGGGEEPPLHLSLVRDMF
jgi:hypothetical protein